MVYFGMTVQVSALPLLQGQFSCLCSSSCAATNYRLASEGKLKLVPVCHCNRAVPCISSELWNTHFTRSWATLQQGEYPLPPRKRGLGGQLKGELLHLSCDNLPRSSIGALNSTVIFSLLSSPSFFQCPIPQKQSGWGKNNFILVWCHEIFLSQSEMSSSPPRSIVQQ